MWQEQGADYGMLKSPCEHWKRVKILQKMLQETGRRGHSRAAEEEEVQIFSIGLPAPFAKSIFGKVAGIRGTIFAY